MNTPSDYIPEQVNPELEGDTNQEQEVEEQEVAEEQSETTELEPKPNDGLPHGVKKRFHTLTERNKAQAREMAIMRHEMDQLRSQQTPSEQKSRDDFLTDEEYIEHIAEKKAISMNQQYHNDMAQRQQYSQAQQIQAQNWNNKVAAIKGSIPDFAEVVGSTDVQLPDSAMEFLHESPVGPQLAYHLAQNEDLAYSLQGMSERQVDRQLMRLENGLSAPAARQKVTKSQPTPKAVGRSGGKANMDNLSMEDWIKSRNNQVHG